MAGRRFSAGDLLAITTSSGKRALARVLRLDKFGLLVQLAAPGVSFEDSGKSAILYVNPASTKQWTKVGVSDVSEVLNGLPTFFFGSSATGFTIEGPGGVSYLKGSEAVAADLQSREDYVLKVLWHAREIERWAEDGTPLVWPWAL